MADKKPPALTVETYADYQVITQPNPLRKVLRPVDERHADDPVARAEQALAGLSSEFAGWMTEECNRLAAAHVALRDNGFTQDSCEELFRAAHDIKGDATTFGYPMAAMAAESLCRIIEHSPNIAQVPDNLIAHHINAIQAIVREHANITKLGMADELSNRLRGMADAYLIYANRERPEHLEAVMSPGIVPGD